MKKLLKNKTFIEYVKLIIITTIISIPIAVGLVEFIKWYSWYIYWG